MRTDDIERAIWLLDDLGLFFGSVAEQERNLYAQKNWATARGNYETASGQLAERFGRGQIRIADLEDGVPFLVQGKAISLDRDLDGGWPAAQIAAQRERGEDDWSQLSRLAGVLLRALAPSYDLENWPWFQDHLRRTPAIARQTEPLDQADVVGVTGFGFLRDRYLLSAIMAETAPRNTLRVQWAERRDSLDREAKAFFQRQAAGSDAPSAADMERQWAEFTKSSLQISQSWSGKTSEPDVPSFGRVSDVDLPLLVRRAARQQDPLAIYALALPTAPLKPAAAPRPAAPTLVLDATQDSAAPVDQADGTSESESERQPKSGAAGSEVADSPATTRFPLPQLSGLDEKLADGQTSPRPATEAALSLPDSPALARVVAVEPGLSAEMEEQDGTPLPSSTEAATTDQPPAANPADSTSPTQSTTVGATVPEADPTTPVDRAATPEVSSPADTQTAIVPDRGLANASRLSAWIDGMGTEGVATLGLALLSFLALSLLMALWLRALFRSERTAEEGDQQIIVVVETERGRHDSGDLATATAATRPGGGGTVQFAPATSSEDPDAWPSSATNTPRHRPFQKEAQVEATTAAEPVPGTAATPNSQDNGLNTPPERAGRTGEPWPEETSSQAGQSANLYGAIEDLPDAAPNPPPSAKDVAPGSFEKQPGVAVKDETAWPVAPEQALANEPTGPSDTNMEAVGTEPEDPSTTLAAKDDSAAVGPLEHDETGTADAAQLAKENHSGSIVQDRGDGRDEPESQDEPERLDQTEARGPIVEPVQIEEALLALRDRQDGVDAPDTPRRPKGPQLYATVVPPASGTFDAGDLATTNPPVEPNAPNDSTPEPDTKDGDPASTQRTPTPTTADPFNPRLDVGRPPQDSEVPDIEVQNAEPGSPDADEHPVSHGPPESPERTPVQESGAPPSSEDDSSNAPPLEPITAVTYGRAEPPAPEQDLPQELAPEEPEPEEPEPEELESDQAVPEEMAPVTSLPESPEPDPPAESSKTGQEPSGLVVSGPQPDSLFKEIGNALRAGDMVQFHTKFSDLTSLPPDRVERILYSPGGEDFAVTCRALGVDKLDFASLFLLVRKQCLGETRVAPHRFSRVLALYDEVEADTAEQVLDRWRTDPNYPGILDRMQNGQLPLDH